MKNHLKRIATPKTWVINRKKNIFIVRPSPGAHSFAYGLPLGVILRDILKLATTMGEVKKIINNKEVLIDNKRRKDHRFIVGLFDVIAIPDLKKYHRVVLDKKGRLVVIDIDEKEATLKPSKIVGKTCVAGGKIQYNLHDGRNMVSDKKANVGDTFLISLVDLKIKEVYNLVKGVTIFLTKGKHAGDLGLFKEIKDEEAIYTKEGEEVETAKEYLFVVGDKKPIVKVN